MTKLSGVTFTNRALTIAEYRDLVLWHSKKDPEAMVRLVVARTNLSEAEFTALELTYLNPILERLDASLAEALRLYKLQLGISKTNDTLS